MSFIRSVLMVMTAIGLTSCATKATTVDNSKSSITAQGLNVDFSHIPQGQVREDCEKLFIILVPFALQQLQKHGEFYPFAGFISPAGQLNLEGADIGKKKPESSEVIEFLTGALHAQSLKGECRATAICVNVRVIPPGATEKTDAVLLRFECQNGNNVNVVVPYTAIKPGTIRTGNAFTAQAKPTKPIFGK